MWMDKAGGVGDSQGRAVVLDRRTVVNNLQDGSIRHISVTFAIARGTNEKLRRTLAPDLPNASAMARPMPLDEPVTTHTGDSTNTTCSAYSLAMFFSDILIAMVKTYPWQAP